MAGFTLLEVMIALAITAGVVITALTSLNYHLTLIEDNKNIIIASILGMEKMEEFGLYKGAEKLVPAGSKQGMEGDFGKGFPQFSYLINIEDTEFKELKQISLKVSWGKDREVSYVTYKLER
ncbi:MAG: prepilin-type N-terminal cleavage/methylation domain-containing protein [Nitrospinae bacterium]|nr:prepilin-type N-terminal cleavage/methylation domain-containing protein [Nitrospinota bacterium]